MKLGIANIFPIRRRIVIDIMIKGFLLEVCLQMQFG